MNYPNTDFQQALNLLGACEEFRKWVGEKSYLEYKKQSCPNPDWEDWLASHLPKGKEEAQLDLYTACQRSDPEGMEVAITRGADPAANNSWSLVSAVRNSNNPKVAELLIQHGADPLAYDSWSLVVAAQENDIPMAKLLVQHGADPAANDSYALALAVRHNNNPMVELLLKYGAGPDARNGFPLRKAEECGYAQMADCLRQAIADKQNA